MLSQILYEDKDIIVVRKPAGIAVQTARLGQPDLVSELKNHLGRGNDGKGSGGGKGGSGMPGGRGEPYLGIVHRLDQPVEGILVFAKNKASAASLTGQLRDLFGQNEEGAFCKRYYAVLCGIPANRQGRLTDYLYKQAVKKGTHMDYKSVIIRLAPGNQNSPACQDGMDSQDSSACRDDRGSRGTSACQDGKDSRNRTGGQNGEEAGGKAGASAPDYAGGSRFSGKQKGQKACLGTAEQEARRAELEYRILQVQEQQGLALTDIRLLTGRFHQIRAQMAHAGTPLLGDAKYGTEETKALAGRHGVRNVALCACQLAFVHPVTKERMDFKIRPENPAFSSFSQELLK